MREFRRDEIGTAVGEIFIPLNARGTRTARASQHRENLMSTLTADQKKIAAAFGIPAEQFATRVARLSRSTDTHGLTPEQLAVAKAFGMSPRAFAVARARQSGGSTALASVGKPGLSFSHQEVDRAHKAAYDANPQFAENASDLELRDAAISALKDCDPNSDDAEMYDRLLDGALYVMQLLERMVPPYPERYDREGRKV
jgi:hypothetical protein